MKIMFNKECKACNFEELYPDVYLKGDIVEVIQEKKDYKKGKTISLDMAIVAVEQGKGSEVKEEKKIEEVKKMDTTEIENKMMPDHENKIEEEKKKIAKEKRNARDRAKRANKKKK